MTTTTTTDAEPTEATEAPLLLGQLWTRLPVDQRVATRDTVLADDYEKLEAALAAGSPAIPWRRFSREELASFGLADELPRHTIIDAGEPGRADWLKVAGLADEQSPSAAGSPNALRMPGRQRMPLPGVASVLLGHPRHRHRRPVHVPVLRRGFRQARRLSLLHIC